MMKVSKLVLAALGAALLLSIASGTAQAQWRRYRVTSYYSTPSTPYVYGYAPGYYTQKVVVRGRPVYAAPVVTAGYYPAPTLVYPGTTAAYAAPATSYYAPAAYATPTTSYYAPYPGVTTYYAPAAPIVVAPAGYYVP